MLNRETNLNFLKLTLQVCEKQVLLLVYHLIYKTMGPRESCLKLKEFINTAHTFFVHD